MGNINSVRVFVATVIALLASIAVPVTNAQTWETVNTYAQVAFDRRDGEGRIYFRARWLLKNGRLAREPGGTPSQMVSYHAVNCSNGLHYAYKESSKQWGEPDQLSLSRGSFIDVVSDYACRNFPR